MDVLKSKGTADTKDLHLGRIILNNLKKWKDDIHQVELVSGDVDTHEDVRVRSIRVAQGLQKRGVGSGDFLVICSRMVNTSCYPLLASFYIGSTVLSFSYTLKLNEVKRMLTLERPKIIFCEASIKNTFIEAIYSLKYVNIEIVVFDDEQKAEILAGSLTITPFAEFLKPTGTEDKFEPVDLDPESTIAAVMPSSGTTGLPKGVCHTHKSFASMIYNFNASKYCYYSTSYYLNFCNNFGITGMFVFLYTCLCGTPRLISSKPFSPELLKKALDEYKPHGLFLNPATLDEVLRCSFLEEMDFSSLKSVAMGGSHIPLTSINILKSKLINGKIYHAYASTEAGHITINIEDKPNSVGKVLPWIKWKIINKDTGKDVRPKETGELYIKKDSLLKCYLNNPEASKEAFDSDGYFKTGDLFYRDTDDFLYFVDRAKEVFKYKGKQIVPAELELEISSLSDVVKVCVIGVKSEREDEFLPLAFVQKKNGSKLSVDDVKDVVKNNLESYKELKGGVLFIQELPYSLTGKPDRPLLKELAKKLLNEGTNL